MHWNSFADFIHMGGYGLYVWGSYGVVLAAMLAESHLSMQRLRRARSQAGSGASNEGDDA